jgi:hypothetical protein
MFPTTCPQTSKKIRSLPVLLVLISCVGAAQAQSNAKPSMRDQAKAIQRAELDRLLLAATPAKADTGATRTAVMKQIREDFKDLQELNNKMMATAWAAETLDYSFLSDMVSRIRGKATRLKTNLNLPGPNGLEEAAADQKAADPKAATDSTISNAREFRKALLLLDQTVMHFVTNPLFQTPNTIEVNLAGKARKDLEAVIALTADLKKTASRLQKSTNSR